MTIGFYYHIPAIKKNKFIYVPGYLGVFLDGLAQSCTKLICYMHSPLKNEVSKLDYKLTSTNVELIDIGPHINMFKRVLKSKDFIDVIEKNISEKNIDIFLLRAPSPLLPTITKCCIKNNIKYSYLIVGDYVKNLKQSKNIKPLKRFILNSFYKYNKYYQDKYAKNALIFTNNPIIFDEYKKLNTHEIRTTTLSENNFYKKDNFYKDNKLNLLYAGRIEPSKGIEDILIATKMIKEENIDVTFNLVGWDDSKAESHLNHLKKRVLELGLKDNFIFHGKKRVGEELFSMYRQSDIYVIATRGDEGFPRTIWEAMANSCLVIASRAGAIPNIIENEKNCLLVDKNSPIEIKENVLRLLEDKELVKNLKEESFKLAQTNTIEKQSLNMINKMKE